MIILGLSGASGSDAAAALLVDQTVVAAATEDAFARTLHAPNRLPWESARFCLQQAEVSPDQVDIVALAFAPTSLADEARWHYARRLLTESPVHALGALVVGNRHFLRFQAQIQQLLVQLGISLRRTTLLPVQHTLALASSAYHLSGVEGPCGILSLSTRGEYATTLLAKGERGRIHKLQELYQPDSLASVFAAMGAYLGLDAGDCHEGIARRALQGHPYLYDLSRLLVCDNGAIKVNTRYINPTGQDAYCENGKRYPFTRKLVDWLGPPCSDPGGDPYRHYAAALQHLHEACVIELLDRHLGDTLKTHGKLVLAGEAARNRKLNQRLAERGDVRELYTLPVSSEAGAALGAATMAAAQHGIVSDKLLQVFLGPAYSSDDCVLACKQHASRPLFEIIKDPAKRAARLIAEGHPLGWFQGRMEFGGSPLGSRGLLCFPASDHAEVTANAARLLGISMVERVAYRLTESSVPQPFMGRYVPLSDEGQRWLPSFLQTAGAIPLHTVSKATTPRYYTLLEELDKMTGYGAVINMPLCHADTAVACTPADALDWFARSPVDYLVMEDVLVRKTK